MMALSLLFGIHLGIIFFLAFLFWRQQDDQLRPYFWPALLLKLAAGVALGLIYTYHYLAGDTFGFFEDACKLTELFWNTPGTYFRILIAADESEQMSGLLLNTQSRSLFLVRIVSLVALITRNNYWVTSLYFSLISFFAGFLLFKKLSSAFPATKLAAAIAFLFFPSVVFWSSGIIKESLALAGLFILVHVYLTLLTSMKLSWWEYLLTPIAAIVVWNLKYYWMAVFMAVSSTTLLIHFITQRTMLKPSIKILIWVGTLLVLCSCITLIHPNFYFENFLQVLTENYNQFVRISSADNVVHYQLEPSWQSILYNSPLAMVSGFFRPFIWEAHNMLQLASGIENLFVLILFFVLLVKWRSISESPQRLLIFSSAMYIIILCVFLALSTPNFGTLARYKIGFQPFLVFMLLAENSALNWMKLKLNKLF
jgi:hypothetical protein